jgi:hypothetical protein
MSTTSAAAAVRLYAERGMIRVWRDSATFETKVKERYSIRYFKGLAQRSKDATPSYSNRDKDSP